MAQNFIACDRGQAMLMPPDLADWVPDDHEVWSILGAVEQMDLAAFYGAYRENGQGRAAYDPSMIHQRTPLAADSGVRLAVAWRVSHTNRNRTTATEDSRTSIGLLLYVRIRS